MLTTVAGTSLSFHVSKPEELEGAVRDVAAHADILWVGVETWTHDCLSAAREIERIRTVTDLAHRHDMGVAFGLHWQSLLPKENAIADCPFAGVVLKPEDGVFQKVRNWDFGSDEALAQFEARLRRLLDLVDRLVELYYQDEIVLGSPGPNFWYQPISTYWTSPTYSEESLASFRLYLTRQGFPEPSSTRFPATTVAVESGPKANDGLPGLKLDGEMGRLLQEDNDWPDSKLWNHWYAWRETLYARWLDVSTRVAAERWGDDPGWMGTLYVMPAHWAKAGLGQNLDRIAALKHVDFISAGYMSGTRFQAFKAAAEAGNKKWGATVELCHYGKREGCPPDAIKKTFREAVAAGASIINVYAGNNFRTDRPDPKDNGLYYMPAQVEAWDQCVREGK